MTCYMNRALQGSIWEFGNVMVLQVGSLFTKAVACGLSISCPLERDNVIYVPNKVSGPHIEKIFSGSSKRLKLLVYHPRPPPSHPPPPNSFKTNADPPPQPVLPKQFVLACSKLGLRVQATSSPSRKSSGWKEYGKWKRPVALVVNPTGYMMLW